MSKRLKQVAIVVIVLFAAAQLIRPSRQNPPTDSSRTINAQVGTASGLVLVLGRACRDCHSNVTVWPWYARIAPLSWVMVSTVKQGRQAVNFSEWGAYPPERQRALLVASCKAATQGTMPGGIWTLLHPEARLSAQDIETICAAGKGGF